MRKIRLRSGRDASPQRPQAPPLPEPAIAPVVRASGISTCPICVQEFCRPVTLGCGHSACEECLTGLFETQEPSGGAFTCPACRSTLARELPHLNIVLQAVIGRPTFSTSRSTALHTRLQAAEAAGRASARYDEHITDDFVSDDDSVSDDGLEESMAAAFNVPRENERRLQRRAYWVYWHYEAAFDVGIGSLRARQVFGVTVTATQCVATPLLVGVLLEIPTIGFFSVVIHLGLEIVAFGIWFLSVWLSDHILLRGSHRHCFWWAVFGWVVTVFECAIFWFLVLPGILWSNWLLLLSSMTMCSDSMIGCGCVIVTIGGVLYAMAWVFYVLTLKRIQNPPFW